MARTSDSLPFREYQRNLSGPENARYSQHDKLHSQRENTYVVSPPGTTDSTLLRRASGLSEANRGSYLTLH